MIANAALQHSLWQGFRDNDDPRQLALVPENPDQIRAVGGIVDKVYQIVPYNTAIHNFAKSIEAMRQTAEWELLCRELVMGTLVGRNDTDSLMDAHIRTLAANQPHPFSDHEYAVKWDWDERIDMHLEYDCWRSAMAQFINEGCMDPCVKNMDRNSRLFCMQVLRDFRERCFFATRDGKIGIGPKEMEPDDDIVILFYCPTPYILRKRKTKEGLDSDTWMFVGEAYVHGLMYEQGLDVMRDGHITEEAFVME